VGIQNHGDGDEVAFRNIRIKELGPAEGDVTVQAESWTEANGVDTYSHAPAHGGTILGYVNPGDWAAYDGVDLTGVTRFTARVASPNPSGGFEIRTGSPTGPVLGSVTVPNTGGWESYADVSTPLVNVPSGSVKLYLVFTGADFDVDDFTLVRGPKDDSQVKLTVTASSRCVGTSAYVAVTAVNAGDAPATIELNTPFGKKTVADVAPGKQAYQSFNTRAGQIDAGTVTVKGTAAIGGKQVTSSYDAAYSAAGCR
jgi:hypothetical protein